MKELKSANQLVDDYRKFCKKNYDFEDVNTKWLVRCNGCHAPVTNEEAAKGELVYSLHKAWHRKHFICICCHCAIGIDGREFRGCPSDRHFPMCLDCFMEQNHPKCEACDRAIRETCLKALGKLWHESCFTCTKCHSPFPQGRFCILNEKAYDVDCYNLIRYGSVLTPLSQFNRFFSGRIGSAFVMPSQTFSTVPTGSGIDGETGALSGASDTSGSTPARTQTPTCDRLTAK